MKMLITTCINESRNEVFKLFKKANITVFSLTEITGIKSYQAHNLLNDWFASGDNKFNSLMIFSFTDETSATNCLELIRHHNDSTKADFPIRVFLMPVDNFV